MTRRLEYRRDRGCAYDVLLGGETLGKVWRFSNRWSYRFTIPLPNGLDYSKSQRGYLTRKSAASEMLAARDMARS